MQVQIIPFRAHHVPEIKPDVPDEWRQLAEIGEKCGRGYTACLLGDPIGCAGVRVNDNGIGEAWALFGPLIKRRPLSLFRAVKTGLDEIIAEGKVKRIHAVVAADDPAAARFMEHLGFPREQRKFFYTREVR